MVWTFHLLRKVRLETELEEIPEEKKKLSKTDTKKGDQPLGQRKGVELKERKAKPSSQFCSAKASSVVEPVVAEVDWGGKDGNPIQLSPGKLLCSIHKGWLPCKRKRPNSTRNPRKKWAPPTEGRSGLPRPRRI